MVECWEQNAEVRPEIGEVVARLKRLGGVVGDGWTARERVQAISFDVDLILPDSLDVTPGRFYELCIVGKPVSPAQKKARSFGSGPLPRLVASQVSTNMGDARRWRPFTFPSQDFGPKHRCLATCNRKERAHQFAQRTYLGLRGGCSTPHYQQPFLFLSIHPYIYYSTSFQLRGGGIFVQYRDCNDRMQYASLRWGRCSVKSILLGSLPIFVNVRSSSNPVSESCE